MQIYYEPHPVSPERKAELRKAGFKIIDARFAPADWKAEKADNEKTAIPAPAKKRGRPKKAGTD